MRAVGTSQSAAAHPYRAGALLRAKLAFALTLAALSAGCATFRSPSPVCLAGAQLDKSGICRNQVTPEHKIPFRAGYSAEVTQGFHGYISHKEDLAFAVDFACEEGTPVVASRDGVVWSVRGDSNMGCSDPECVEEANYVVLDHGDGTYTSYYHLQHFGALVQPGEQVCAGQIVGLCGNTGFSSGSHLHFAQTNLAGVTLPVRFEEARRMGYAFPLPRATYASRNDLSLTCDDTDYSTLPRDAFAHQGIFLEQRLPTVLELGAGLAGQRIKGEYRGRFPNITIHRRAVGSDQWEETCVPVDKRGRFDALLPWAPGEFGAGYYFFMITGSDAECGSPGWAWSYRVRVDRP
ncbi:M23 family metallopeptidase [Lujinxingia vulgaris]|uniref:M23 family metallopeptidase n=1 Tax=Lujinxingia vulgaris TaxID=2600176 RepID=A0A5C6X937_9DELT|nr:M23 family metallopeptidase [Lujinxingia vulgaris]TXD36865.1 M23 family metallopeptidase [Lujinxingia vulgaris]